MPRVFISVACLVILIVIATLFAIVGGEQARRRWIQLQQRPRLKAEQLEAERAADEMRAGKLRVIEHYEQWAKTNPAQAEMLHWTANNLRQELNLPRKQYPENDPDSTVAPGEAAAQMMPKRNGDTATEDAPPPEIPRLQELPPSLRPRSL